MDNILIEFYLIDKYIPNCYFIFQTLIKSLGIHTIYCKSFDFLLLNCCLKNSYTYRPIGTLFRDYVDAEIISTKGLSIRYAEIDDYSFLLQQEGELYETPDELYKFVSDANQGLKF